MLLSINNFFVLEILSMKTAQEVVSEPVPLVVGTDTCKAFFPRRGSE